MCGAGGGRGEGKGKGRWGVKGCGWGHCTGYNFFFFFDEEHLPYLSENQI